ncbi:DUF3581 family protein [Vibrio lentus]|nr:DUF3581 family protein [Vibrio lentus]
MQVVINFNPIHDEDNKRLRARRSWFAVLLQKEGISQKCVLIFQVWWQIRDRLSVDVTAVKRKLTGWTRKAKRVPTWLSCEGEKSHDQHSSNT